MEGGKEGEEEGRKGEQERKMWYIREKGEEERRKEINKKISQEKGCILMNLVLPHCSSYRLPKAQQLVHRYT